MEFTANPVKPQLEDVFMTAILLAAEELAIALPQPQGDSILVWKGYLLQQALKRQAQMTEEQRCAYRFGVLTDKLNANESQNTVSDTKDPYFIERLRWEVRNLVAAFEDLSVTPNETEKINRYRQACLEVGTYLLYRYPEIEGKPILVTTQDGMTLYVLEIEQAPETYTQKQKQTWFEQDALSLRRLNLLPH